MRSIYLKYYVKGLQVVTLYLCYFDYRFINLDEFASAVLTVGFLIVNLLFFGNFYKMQMDDYLWAMNQMMKDGEYLSDSMVKDVYHLGIVLAKKYRYLRISYTIFMYGLIVAVIAFGLVALMTAGSGNTSIPTIDY